MTAHLNAQWPSGLNSYPQQPPMRQNSGAQTSFGGYPVIGPTTSRRPSNSTNRSDSTNIVTNVERLRGSRENIPTVAEQLDEKRRLKAARERSVDSQAPSSFPGLAPAHSRTGTSSNPSEDGANANSHTVSVSHASSRFFANRHNTGDSTTTTTASGGLMSPGSTTLSSSTGLEDSDAMSPVSPSRRNSLMKSWKRRRIQRVMNPGSETHILMESTPLPLNSTVAGEGQTTTPGEVGAQIPGARVPTARDRENPPPEYSNTG